jgi:hypothetical protein
MKKRTKKIKTIYSNILIIVNKNIQYPLDPISELLNLEMKIIHSGLLDLFEQGVYYSKVLIACCLYFLDANTIIRKL